MSTTRTLLLIAMLLIAAPGVRAADVILNEYNAVDSDEFLGGGDSSMDESGGRASDAYFGRVLGNGGDWFELVVVKDHLNMKGWQLDISEGGVPDETLTLTQHAIWGDLRAGTIITIAEEVPSDVSYNPAAGDWWINVQAHNDGDGLYIEKSNFPVSSKDWQLRIRNATGQVVFGPAGEGISPASGIGGVEVFRLEEDPDATITADSSEYDDGDDFSTFGAPNRWGSQDFADLRPVLTPSEATIKLVSPNGGDALSAGEVVTVQWTSTGITETVLVEFSIDDGATWTPVYPPNEGNTGQYKWLVPLVDTDTCLVRVSSSTRPSVYDVSDDVSAIVQITLVADLTGDLLVNFFDFALMASAWMQ